jgi:ubiquinone/menaquinone biosynthesis C-methylase UbiE
MTLTFAPNPAPASRTMEGFLARWYAKTRANDMSDFVTEAQEFSQTLAPNAEVLEIAPGPGFFSIELAKLGNYKITALDLSKTLLDISRQNAENANVQIDFRLGDVHGMPFPPNSFDAAYCSAAFKNFSDPLQALREIHRVLRPGATATIVDLRKDVSLAEIKTYVHQSGRSRLDAFLTTLIFRHTLIKRAYTQAQFQDFARRSPFHEAQITPGPIGLKILLTKPH